MDELKLTVFYFKKSGNIFGVWAGSVDFSVFGEDVEDYKLLMNKIVVDPEQIPVDLSKAKVLDGTFAYK
ncbi:hypothetical protein [Proteiniclasticum sp.]|uniref:hypothetical protein n=1 Tax=Proteiniclasticum sp. TaxID=2053595 RepID=UPI00289C11FA|nr:hypothetical protein [Proteiniclasticum sp.]